MSIVQGHSASNHPIFRKSPSQMFTKKLLKNTSMCSNDRNKILDADHY